MQAAKESLWTPVISLASPESYGKVLGFGLCVGGYG